MGQEIVFALVFFSRIYLSLFSRNLLRGLVDLHLELQHLQPLELGLLRLQLLLEGRVLDVRRVDVDVGRGRLSLGVNSIAF